MKKETVQLVRPYKLKLGDIEQLNALTAGGCVVMASQPERWHLEKIDEAA
jgi:hypothetical protein